MSSSHHIKKITSSKSKSQNCDCGRCQPAKCNCIKCATRRLKKSDKPVLTQKVQNVQHVQDAQPIQNAQSGTGNNEKNIRALKRRDVESNRSHLHRGRFFMYSG